MSYREPYPSSTPASASRLNLIPAHSDVTDPLRPRAVAGHGAGGAGYFEAFEGSEDDDVLTAYDLTSEKGACAASLSRLAHGPPSPHGGLPTGTRPPPPFTPAPGSISASLPGHDRHGSSRGGSSAGGAYDPAYAEHEVLRYAEGDAPDSKLARSILWLLDSNIAVRWTLYILPGLALSWIPGILALTVFKSDNDAHLSQHPGERFAEPSVWSVGLFWWSIWLSIFWVGWWAAWAVAKLGPLIATNTAGIIVLRLKHYIAYVRACESYLAFFLWTLVVYVSWTPLVYHMVPRSKQNPNPSDLTSDQSTLFQFRQFFLGFMICAAILLGEKLLIQVIAWTFHEKSYESRIQKQKFQIKALTALYQCSRNDLNRSDSLGNPNTYDAVGAGDKRGRNPFNAIGDGLSTVTKGVKKGMKGAKKVVQQSTSMLGNIASEIAGQSILQPNSPQSVVTSALSSAKQTRQLARRIYYSYVPPGRDYIELSDIRHCFPNEATAQAAFEIFDRDLNGDITREEIDMALMDIHRERLALVRSMSDIDSAVGNVDKLFMSVYVLVAAVIIAAFLSVKFSTLITSFGTIILGLSWLIGTTAQEIILSVIFVFAKHPYDVGDAVMFAPGDDSLYVVKEIQLLSTVFRRGDGQIVQMQHSVLALKPIVNFRRSGPITETFEFDVAYSTTFEQVEALRESMLRFVESEKRDFQPGLDIVVKDFAKQQSLTLGIDIRYKSNWQTGALKTLRRNKFLCTLKRSMKELEIFGPKGDPDADGTQKIVLAPWPPSKYKEDLKEDAAKAEAMDRGKSSTSATGTASRVPPPAYHLTDASDVINAPTLDVFDEGPFSFRSGLTTPSVGTPGSTSRGSAQQHQQRPWIPASAPYQTPGPYQPSGTPGGTIPARRPAAGGASRAGNKVSDAEVIEMDDRRV